MTYLSLFSGLEAASVAWLPLGWTCAAVAEIEPFPCAVLKHHYPDVPNLGDVTKITEQQINDLGHIDLVVFGSPCQDLSIAGKRAGLEGERSGLFFSAMRIVRWSGARFALWENVPGAFSSNGGLDFASVVREMAGVELNVPDCGWQNTGVALGGDGLLEWAVLDAQWFGVPQRRRRIFALRDIGNWRDRPPILFEQYGLQGNTPPRREAGKNVAPTISARTKGGGGLGTDFDLDGGLIASTGDVSHRLNAGGMGRQDYETETLVTHSLRADGFDASEDGTGRATPLIPVIAPCLTGNYGKQPDNSDTSAGPMLIPVIQTSDQYKCAECAHVGDEASHGKTCPTCGSTYYENMMIEPTMGPLKGTRFDFDLQRAIPILEAGARTGKSTDDIRAGSGIGESGDPMYTLQSGKQHAVAFVQNTRDEVRLMGGDGQIVGALGAETGAKQQAYIAFPCKDHGADAGEIAPTLRSMGHDGSHANAGGQVAIAFNLRGREDGAQAEVSEVASLRSASGGSSRSYVAQMAVRRLTPVECERLQEFPDDFTKIPYPTHTKTGKPVKRKRYAKDGPRYKALGNSMCTAVMAYIGRQVDAATKPEARRTA